jgi:hypothetical protein
MVVVTLTKRTRASLANGNSIGNATRHSAHHAQEIVVIARTEN